MEVGDIKYQPGAHIFGVSLEQDLLLINSIWGRRKREEAIKMILKTYSAPEPTTSKEEEG